MDEPCDCPKCKGGGKHVRTKDSITVRGFLATEHLSPRQAYTAAGFLLCQDAPIARIGTQDYHELELPDLESKDGIIVVERNEDVVFDPETIASFEGVPVTLDHPTTPVTPENWGVLAKGYAHNVRRGEGALSDHLVADLLVTDKGAIHEITSKQLRELSCGYDSDYQQIAPGRARQVSIVGNHVALVKSARCGVTCAVQDSNNSFGTETMATAKDAKPMSVKDKLRKLFMTRDSEAFEESLAEVPDDGVNVVVNMPAAPAAEDPNAPVLAAISGVAASVAALAARVDAIEAAGKAVATTADAGDPDKKDDAKPDPDKKDDVKKDDATKDSGALMIEFQDAISRAEIIAPGLKLPTFDAAPKRAEDVLCDLRRRALTAASENANKDIVKSLTGDADVSKMTCDSVKVSFMAASEIAKHRNLMTSRTQDHQQPAKSSWDQINDKNAQFWADRK